MQAEFDPVAVACSPQPIVLYHERRLDWPQMAQERFSQTSPRRVLVQGEGKAA